jgi:hypothetical protein
MLTRAGSPWHQAWKKKKFSVIEDKLIKEYYKKILENESNEI